MTTSKNKAQEAIAPSESPAETETTNSTEPVVVNAEAKAANKPAGKKKVKKEKDPESPENVEAATQEKEEKPEEQKPKKQKTPAIDQKEEQKPAKKKKVSKTPLSPPAAIEKLKKEIAHLNLKSTQRIASFQEELTKLSTLIEKTEDSLQQELAKLAEEISSKHAQNSEYQKELQSKTEEIVKNLEASLESGKSEEALTLWDTVQGNISNTSGKIRSALQARIGEHKTKLDDLKSWKTFASTEKKKELIEQMKHLVESKMHASDRSRHINKMHSEWKSLGHSNQNESLWKEFKKLSDKAYEPCKEFFKKRKELMSSNLKKRREICDALENKLESITSDSANEPNAVELGKLIHSYESDWKKHAPVEQSKIKNIQKRFYSGINKLRKIRKKQQRTNAALKKKCIAEAQLLVEQEDNGKAMSEAKKLQGEWKKIGSSSYREDEKYWKEFRAACDKIFSKKSEQSSGRDDQFQEMEKAFHEILGAMEKLFEMAEEEFRSSRNEFQELTHKFSNTVDHQFKKRRKRLVDNFNSLKRKIEVRYSALPDKKQQELKSAILERVEFLQSAEDKLLASKSEEKFKQVQESVDQEQWRNIDELQQQEYAKALDKRFEQLLKADSLEAYSSLANETESLQRKSCIMSELRAEIDSPEGDQALRMELQLQLLQKGFGQSSLASSQDRKELFKMEMEMLCIGPIDKSARSELQQRIETALNKLRQKSR